MLRTLKLAAGAGALALACTIAGGWYYATSEPSQQYLALPDTLVDARSPQGQSLLESTPSRADFDALTRYYATQSRRGYCGVASGTMVVNALDTSAPRLSQDTFFTVKASAVRSSLKVTLAGMTLDELADLLRAHDLQVSVVHASESRLEDFRKIARDNLSDTSDFLLVNYDRATLHQEGSGHISPVVAHHHETDRFLVLDVASYKYPPTWVPAMELWTAMSTSDTSSGRSRSFLVARRANLK
jgi:glutathione-S-conjugate glycine hydrolase